MAIQSTNNEPKNIINIDGANGNANTLIHNAKKLARQLYLNEESIVKEMKQGDYSHLVRTFEKYFGDYIILAISDKLKEEIFG
jgi:hypothetical protein